MVLLKLQLHVTKRSRLQSTTTRQTGSLFFFKITMFMMMMILISRCCCSVRAWVSCSPLLPRKFLIVRGGSADGAAGDYGLSDRRLMYSSTSTTSTRTSITPPPPPPPAGGEEEDVLVSLQSIANRLANDSLMEKSKRNFGGIDYFDTTIDTRFRVIFVLGGPGSGKGTQSAYMVNHHYPVVHYSVGELLRNVDKDNPQKQIIDQYLQNGQIVPVQVSLALLKSAMEKHQAQPQTNNNDVAAAAATATTSETKKDVLYLVDGFPRNYDNLQGWANFMSDSTVLAAVLVYTCPLTVLEQRILSRNQGRSDDTISALHKRFRTFEEETMPVVRALQNAVLASSCWSVVEIDGNQDIASVWQTTQEYLKQYMVHDVVTANQRLLTAAVQKDASTYLALCDPKMFGSNDGSLSLENDFLQTEQTADSDIVAKARVDVMTGQVVAVSYDRTMNGVRIREKRIWSHQKNRGWRNIHFQRTPCAD